MAGSVCAVTVFFVSKFSIILLSVIFFWGGGGCHASLKQLKTSLAFVCLCLLFCVLLVFDDFRFELCDNSAPSLFENDREFL